MWDAAAGSSTDALGLVAYPSDAKTLLAWDPGGCPRLEIHDGDVATAFALEALSLVDHF